MLVGDMRKKVKSVYANPTWDKKVDGMPDRQIIAIFYNMEEKGKFKKKEEKTTDSYKQINLFDCFGIDERVG
jgi:hypothetical protein